MTTDLNTRIETLATWMLQAKHLVVFTGAGISTESGLPDFRGPDGLWTRRDQGLPPPKSRDFTAAEPNAGHMAIVELQRLDKLAFLISQNVDNLHLKSGIRPESLAELHGNIAKLRCPGCAAQFDKASGVDVCPDCGARLVSSVVDFGQSLPQKDLADSYQHSQICDLFVVVGSSLVVTPAAEMPGVAVRSRARLVIINQGDTPFDRVAHLRFDEPIGDVLPVAVERLKQLMGVS